MNGVAYNFVTKTQMEAAIDNDEFIEYATFAGNMYGTSKAAVKTVMDKGRTFYFLKEAAKCNLACNFLINCNFCNFLINEIMCWVTQ